MTQQEFETLTQVNVASSEFDAINRVYMDSDVDKETFCKFWCKINKSRVLAAKVDRIEAERNAQATRDLLWSIVNCGYTQAELEADACDHLGIDQRDACRKVGIDLFDYARPKFCKSVSDICYEVNKYLSK